MWVCSTRAFRGILGELNLTIFLVYMFTHPTTNIPQTEHTWQPYSIYPKYLNRHALTSNVYPDQSPITFRVYIVCHSANSFSDTQQEWKSSCHFDCQQSMTRLTAVAPFNLCDTYKIAIYLKVSVAQLDACPTVDQESRVRFPPGHRQHSFM